MLSVELQRQPAGSANVSLKAIEKGSSAGLPSRTSSSNVTHAAKIKGWMRRRFEILLPSYINKQIAAFEFPAGNIVNIDEMNINFDICYICLL